MMRLPCAPSRRSPTQLGRLCRVASYLSESLPLALFLVALLAGLARSVLLLLARLRLDALLLPRPLLTAALLLAGLRLAALLLSLLTAALLLAGLLVGCLFRLRSVVRIIHLSTSFG
jgi:hypothetical protein